MTFDKALELVLNEEEGNIKTINGIAFYIRTRGERKIPHIHFLSHDKK